MEPTHPASSFPAANMSMEGLMVLLAIIKTLETSQRLNLDYHSVRALGRILARTKFNEEITIPFNDYAEELDRICNAELSQANTERLASTTQPMTPPPTSTIGVGEVGA